MFKKLRLRIAARRLERQKNKSMPTDAKSAAGINSDVGDSSVTSVTSKQSFIKRAWGWIIALPSRFWNWVRKIDIIGLANIALLSFIIVAFSVLILNITDSGNRDCDKSEPFHIAQNQARPRIVKSVPDTHKPVKVTAKVTINPDTMDAVISLPLKKALRQVEKANKSKITHQAIGKNYAGRNRLLGDIVIDGIYITEHKPVKGDIIKGNMIIQNMRKYTIPCGIKIDGNLILRNVGLLRFCDDLYVTGNIYVNRNSSFGPIPSTARVGGQVIF